MTALEVQGAIAVLVADAQVAFEAEEAVAVVVVVEEDDPAHHQRQPRPHLLRSLFSNT